MTIPTALKNVLVIGGSYVGQSTAQQLAAVLPVTHRVLLIEPHSHFHHLFAFPRYAVLPSHEHKAFIPHRPFAASPNPELHAVVRARVLSIQPGHVTLDRPFHGSKTLEYEYLAVATGTRLAAPGTMEDEEKAKSVLYFQGYQGQVKSAKKVVIVGGGAVGVQMATDLKELYPEKEVTLVQSRRVMPRYHEKFHELIVERFKELGVELVSGSRAIIPPGGFTNEKEVVLQDGRRVAADLIIEATGQQANNELVQELNGEGTVINPDNGFIRVLPTLQFKDPRYPYMFAVGDIADTGANKAARPGAVQAEVVAKNVAALVEGKEPVDKIEIEPAGIHLTLGIVKNIVFRNPGAGETEPWFKWRDDGVADMGIAGVWARRNVRVNGEDDYHL